MMPAVGSQATNLSCPSLRQVMFHEKEKKKENLEADQAVCYGRYRNGHMGNRR